MRTKDFLGNEWDIGCMGCAISSGTMPVPGGFIRKIDHFCVHQDPLIPLPGFLVIASLRHIKSLSEMHASEYEEFSTLLRMTHAAIQKTTGVESLTLVQEEHSSHFHLWFFPWTQTVIEKYGRPTLTKIREIMADYQGRPIGALEWEALVQSITDIKQHLSEDPANS